MKSAFQIDVIARIKKLRESKGINQMQAAKLIDVSPGHYGNIESLKFAHKFTLKQIAIICDKLDYPIQMILCGKENPSIPELIDAIINYEG